ncbi:MAG TPA: SDR family NAD(P)-dependent oxidoreductase [Herpetosiphonaceae bacterium]
MNSIAIIGMAGRFPGANTIEQFWENLRDGKDSITHFDEAELDLAAIDAAELHSRQYVKARGILDNVEHFDAAFFDMSPREAQITDPQHRLFLECASEALEQAGYDPTRYSGAIGLYGGAGANTYMLYNLAAAGRLHGTMNTFQSFIHNKHDHLTARVAYKLDLRGPVVTVQTACSTSLVAVVMACQSLLNSQSDIALAGGATISVPQKTGYLYHESGIGAPDGTCRPFDAEAQGTVGGNGVGLVVLKRLDEALADGDTIHAVIRGAAINNDGSDRIGYTAPGAESQAEVIGVAHMLAEVDPESIGYVEAHGTATPIGDPIEVQALTQAFRRRTEKNQFCAIGSVKGNIGHLDTAAGVTGLIKTVLALKHRQIPPSIHFTQPNPHINFASSPFFVNDRLREWSPGATPRRAGVSSFGLGGTNAHLVLEEAPEPAPSGPARAAQLLVVSARTDSALEQACIDLSRYLKDHPALNIADVAYTLQLGRRSFAHRRMLVCHDTAQAATMLEALVPEQVFSRVQEPISRPLTFMFPGQGAQHVGMAAQLYATEPVFRAEIDRCCELLKPHLGCDLRSVLYPAAPGDAQTAKTNGHTPGAEILEQTQYAQPALFVIEYALAKLWMAWGLKPYALIGHSVGEYVAACLAGVFSLEDALMLVALRGQLIQQLPAGAMLVVPLSEEAVRPLLNERLALAAVNGPALCVVAGEQAAIDEFAAELTAQGLLPRTLHTSHAFHSHMMEPMLEQFAQAISRVKLQPPQMPYLSNVSGTWITAVEATDPQYWVRHIRQTVRFADGLAELLRDPDAVLLEVGPGRTLRTIARWHPHKKPNQFMLASLPHPQEPQDELTFLLHTIGHLWLSGIEIDWEAFYAHESRRRLPLPTYPFERQRHWIDFQGHAATPATHSLEDALRKNPAIEEWFYQPTWQRSTEVVALDSQPAPVAETWLVFAGDDTGKQLAQRLSTIAQNLIIVEPGAEFRRHDRLRYQVNPQRRADYEALLVELHAQLLLPQTIVHGWSLGTHEPLEHGFYSLLALAQALGTQRVTDPVRLLVLSDSAQEVLGGDLLNPEQATIFGPCLVIPREYPNIHCRSIDVAVPPPGSWQHNRLLDQLQRELTTATGDSAVAYRGGNRWQRVYEPIRLEAPSAPPLRQTGVYLITGGLGGLGLTFAAHLGRRAAARLVLVGRSAFPARAEWDAWLATHAASDGTTRKIRQIQALEADGAEVLICQADVTDETQLRQVVELVHQRFGTIHGVIHAAGVPAGGLAQLKQRDVAAQVLAPKIQGTHVLERIFAGTQLDFWLLCSSLTSVVGRLGQIDYTAANAFLDAFAHEHTARTGIPTIAVNWGAWDEVGMAAVPAQTPLSAPAAPIQFTQHPLLERCLRHTAAQQVFATDFTVEKHWVLDEHRILGHPVIPGVAYFEMVRAALQAHPRTHAVEFREVFFVAPLRVPDGARREVRLVIEPAATGYSFAIHSHEHEADHVYTVGKVSLSPAEPLRRHNLAALRERCNVQELILPAEQREEDLGPRWHSVQRVHIGVNEVLLELHLPEAFAGDFAQMVFHPALLDRAAGIAKNFLAADGHYLPLTYNSLKIKGQLQPKIFSYARFRAEENPDRDTITFDIVLMNEDGDALVEIERFTQKRVNDPAAELRALAGTVDLAAPAVPPANQIEEIRPSEGAEALERILAYRGFQQVIVSVRDLYASIRYTDEVVNERIAEAKSRSAEPAAAVKRPRPALSGSYAPPRSETERAIAGVWEEMLSIEQVGIHDNFFELGGDSLVGIEAVARLSTALGVDIPAVNLFEGPTVSALAQIVEQRRAPSAANDSLAVDDSRARADKRRELREERRPRRVEQIG